MNAIAPYWKAVTAFIGALGVWGATALADDAISTGEWFGLLGVVAATAAVWRIPNATDTLVVTLEERGASDAAVAVFGLLIGVCLGVLYMLTR